MPHRAMELRLTMCPIPITKANLLDIEAYNFSYQTLILKVWYFYAKIAIFST